MSCKNEYEVNNETLFRYNQESGINSLDPAFARDQAIIWATQQLFNGLLKLDTNLNIVPDIATSFFIDSSHTKYVFVIRNDVRFQESEVFGSKKYRFVTANDFVFSFKRLLDPKVASPGRWVFAEKLVEPIDSAFIAHNDSVLEIRLKNPFPPLLGLLTMPYCFVVPHEAISALGNDFRTKPIGTGPFKVFLWEENEQLILHRNEKYFELNKPKFKAVQVSFIADRQSAFLAFLQGKTDFISGIDASFKDAILDNIGAIKPEFKNLLQLHRTPYLNTEYIGINLKLDTLPSGKPNPFLNKLVRNAFSLSFNRDEMIKYLRNNLGIAGKIGFVPPALPGNFSENTSNTMFNPQLAKKLLKQAGYHKHNPMPEVVLYVTPTYVDLCTFVQKQANEVGFNIKLETVPGPTLRQLISKGACALFRGSWIADYPDAENYLSLFHSNNFPPNGPNYTRFSNSTFDSLHKIANSIPEIEQRSIIYKQLDSIVANQYPFAVLYYDEVVRLTKPNLVQFKTNAINQLMLLEAYKLGSN